MSDTLKLQGLVWQHAGVTISLHKANAILAELAVAPAQAAQLERYHWLLQWLKLTEEGIDRVRALQAEVEAEQRRITDAHVRAGAIARSHGLRNATRQPFGVEADPEDSRS